MKVVNEEGVGSEVKGKALGLMRNLATDEITPKMYSDTLFKVGCLLF